MKIHIKFTRTHHIFSTIKSNWLLNILYILGKIRETM